MEQLQQILNERRNKLVGDIQILSQQKTNILQAIKLSSLFIENSLLRTESDIKALTKDFLSNLGKRRIIEYSSDEVDQFNKFLMQSTAYEASELIPEEFGKINQPNYLMDEFGQKNDNFDVFFIQDKDNLKMFTFIYHQFFISLIATLDDYFSQILLLILKAHPKKLENLTLKIKFHDISNFLDLGKDEIVIKSIDDQIIAYVRNLMAQKPFEYLNKLVTFLGDTRLMRLEKLAYCEMCLRRNVGVHSGWVGNQEYNLKIEEIIKGDTGNELNLSYNVTNFLGFDKDYFDQAFTTSENILIILKTHCENKFAQQDYN